MFKAFIRGIFANLPILFLTVGVSHASSEPLNVVFITVDGVRYQEFFTKRDPRVTVPMLREHRAGFPELWKRAAEPESRLWIFGDPNDHEIVKINNPHAISLPSYQAIFSGESQEDRCRNNDCGRITVETFPERLVRHESFSRETVASITSWPHVGEGIESTAGTIFGNYGSSPLIEAGFESLNARMAKAPSPWGETRIDKLTEAYALGYLKLHQPRFLHIGLNDTDEYGHAGDYAKYVEAMRQQDRFIGKVLDTLEQMGSYGERTAVILTTDHGRGRGLFWKDHRKEFASAKRAFFMVRMPSVLKDSVRKRAGSQFSHADIRPTIEALLGVTPLPGASGTTLFEEKSP